MIQKIEGLIAKMLISRAMPTSWIIHAWNDLTGARTYLAIALWVIVYACNHAQFGIFADNALARPLMNALAGVGTAALLEKFKRYLPVVDSVIDAAKTQIIADPQIAKPAETAPTPSN